ncbi:hypothetical protein L1987_38245 [Smallanthus sonchifolius]|uniref:Uncharacterized protein n=1 Tax=Smallanthus sonchifolius TaxID=185202 RepID=A0ACB9HIN8_9ASTR|nr:hypothetical protein L1987_38245 [Smallanthus sonchifolius]
MEKLKQLIINCNHIPSINHPAIICERPQFQLLYEELASIIQTLFIDQHQDLERVNDLKKRFIYAAEEAQYKVDLFLSSVHIRNNGDFPTSEDFNPSLNLDDVRRSFESVKVEFMSMRIDNMKMDSSPRPERTLNKSAPISFTRNSQGSKKLTDEIFVGLDRDLELIRDKLVEDRKKLDVVSIVVLEEIPLEIGEIPTLERIQIEHCRYSVEKSVRRIQEEQRDLGNYDLFILILSAN